MSSSFDKVYEVTVPKLVEIEAGRYAFVQQTLVYGDKAKAEALFNNALSIFNSTSRECMIRLREVNDDY